MKISKVLALGLVAGLSACHPGEKQPSPTPPALPPTAAIGSSSEGRILTTLDEMLESGTFGPRSHQFAVVRGVFIPDSYQEEDIVIEPRLKVCGSAATLVPVALIKGNLYEIPRTPENIQTVHTVPMTFGAYGGCPANPDINHKDWLVRDVLPLIQSGRVLDFHGNWNPETGTFEAGNYRLVQP